MYADVAPLLPNVRVYLNPCSLLSIDILHHSVGTYMCHGSISYDGVCTEIRVVEMLNDASSKW